jgi:hypothetical protein
MQLRDDLWGGKVQAVQEMQIDKKKLAVED